MPLIRCRRFYCYFDVTKILSNLIVCKFFNGYFLCFMACFLSLSPPAPFKLIEAQNIIFKCGIVPIFPDRVRLNRYKFPKVEDILAL